MLAMAPSEDSLVRNLLDQRAQRADIPPSHARYSTFSQASESPSLYSHFSPNYRNTPATPASRFPHTDEHNFYEHDTTPYPPSPADRLADPNASSLDLSEDNYSTRASTILDVDIEGASITQSEDDEDTNVRLSLMGPKMRVHSRAPWEEDGIDGSESDHEDSGMDGRSIFGGKKSGFAMMRGLGFGARSPAPRPSFESSSTSKDKRSLESSSSGTASSSHGVLHALAQASISSTSLALGPSTSNRFPHGRLNAGRDRSASASASFSNVKSIPPPLPSPRSAAFSERSLGRTTPSPGVQRSMSPSQSMISVSVDSRTRSPSPNANGAFVHPYANPALLGAYQRDSSEDPRLISRKSSESEQAPIDGSVENSAQSEETVTLSHASTANTSSIHSGLGSMTPLTSTFSLVSAQSYRDLSPGRGYDHETDGGNMQRRVRRETRLGPISNPTLVSHGDYAAATPVTLISLEQAQAQAKERNRSATSPLPSPAGPVPAPYAQGVFGRPRTSSINTAGLSIGVGERSSPASPLSFGANKQPSPDGVPPARVIKPKRSGFMKLFNGKEKERSQEFSQPPVPALPTHYGQPLRVEHSYPPTGPAQPKITSHRVPPPSITGSSTSLYSKQGGGIPREDPRTKRATPLLSIKVTSPQISNIENQDSFVARNSDGSNPYNADTLRVVSHKIPTSAPAGTTQFPSLSVRPISTFFSSSFAEQFLSDESSPASTKNTDASSLISPTSINSDASSLSPTRAYYGSADVPDSALSFTTRSSSSASLGATADDSVATIASLKEKLQNASKKWQHQVWELEGQVRDLRSELEELKSGDKCEYCGRGLPKRERDLNANGVVNRPRAKTGSGARFASGNEI